MSETGQRVEIIEIVDEFRDLLQGDAVYLLAAACLIAALYSLADLIGSASAIFVPSLVIAIYGQFLVIERLLKDRLPEGRGFRRFASIFGSGFLSGLGILLGLLALVIPAIFLIARWSIAVPAIVAENATSTESLSISWDRTAASKVPLSLIYIVAVIVWAGSVWFPAVVSVGASDGNALLFSVFGNAMVGVVTVLGWVLSVAIYRCVTPYNKHFEEVFA
jgi:hypothetical protein